MATIELERLEITPDSSRVWTWYPKFHCDLLDVRLVKVEGNVDVTMVLVGTIIQTAFQRRTRHVLPGQYVRVNVDNLGDGIAKCAVEIHYRERSP